MNKHRKSKDPITDMAEATAERVRLDGDMLIALAQATAVNEKTQRKFRAAVIHKLARIEALLGLVHVSQLARNPQPALVYEEKLRKDAQAAEEFISSSSYETGLAFVKYIYGTENDVVLARDKRQWSGWEI